MANFRMIALIAVICFQKTESYCKQGVYFAAFTNRHYSNKELTTEAVIKFQDVETNQGLAYNSATGVFTAPFDGGYRFDWFILINQDGQLWVCLEKNGACVVKSVGYAGSGYYSEITHSAILQLKAGDSVRLTYSLGPASIYGAEGRYTGFSGQYLD